MAVGSVEKTSEKPARNGNTAIRICYLEAMTNSTTRSKTVEVHGFTVIKTTFMGQSEYEYRGIRVWRAKHSKGNRMSMGNGWRFQFGTLTLVGEKVVPHVRFESTLAEAFAEIDRLFNAADQAGA